MSGGRGKGDIVRGEFVITYNLATDEVTVRGLVPDGEIARLGIMAKATAVMQAQVAEQQKRKVIEPPVGLEIAR
jgi:hypothetical protein